MLISMLAGWLVQRLRSLGKMSCLGCYHFVIDGNLGTRVSEPCQMRQQQRKELASLPDADVLGHICNYLW